MDLWEETHNKAKKILSLLYKERLDKHFASCHWSNEGWKVTFIKARVQRGVRCVMETTLMLQRLVGALSYLTEPKEQAVFIKPHCPQLSEQTLFLVLFMRQW